MLKRLPLASLLIATLLPALLAVTTFRRNRIWTSDYTLYLDVAGKSPRKPRPHEGLGAWYRIQERYDEAILEYARTLAIDSSYREVYDGLFFMAKKLENSGQFSRARTSYALICGNAPPVFQRAKALACESVERLDAAPQGN